MKDFLRKAACSTPVLGHLIAIGFLFKGHKELAKNIFMDATNTTALVTTVAATFVAAGPVGAIIAVKATTAGIAVAAASVVTVATTPMRGRSTFPTQYVQQQRTIIETKREEKNSSFSRERREPPVDRRPVQINSKPETTVDLERQGPKPSGSSTDKSQGKEAHPVTPQSQGNIGFALGMGYVTIIMLSPLFKIRPVTTMSKYLILQAKEVTRTPLLRLGLSRLTAVTLPTASPSSSLIGTNAKESQQHNQKQQQSLNQSSASRGGNSGRPQQELTQSGGQRGNEQPNRKPERNEESTEERLTEVRRQREELEGILLRNGVHDARRFLREITQHARRLRDIVNDENILFDLTFLTQREQERFELEPDFNRRVEEIMGWPLSKKPKKLKARSDEFYRSNNVICVIQDTTGQDHVGYSLRLAQALMARRSQDIQYPLVSEFPDISPRLIRHESTRYFDFTTNRVDELTRCAEQMAYDSLHRERRDPRYTYAIIYQDGVVRFREPCMNCEQYPENQVYGMIAIKGMDKKTEIPLDYDEEFDGQSQ